MRNPRHVGANDALTIVIKLGTSSIVNEGSYQPQLALLAAITETVCSLKALGHRVVLVSSGAIGMGLKRMDLKKRPKALQEKQALAAIGQGRLIALWDNLFSMLGQPIAQVLLTRSDISDRSRYLNSTKTLSSLLSYGVIPIINENDTVSVSEIKFGDNDTLSAIAASMVQADYLFLLTDVDCLYTENPRRFPDTAKPVRIVRDIEAVRQLVSTATLGSSLGTGGMETKIIAAELATGAGVATIITHGMHPSNILGIVSQSHLLHTDTTEGEAEYTTKTPLHTLFIPKESPLSDRRWWVLHGLKPRGRIIIDEGAYRAIVRSSLHSSTGQSAANGIHTASSSTASTPSSSTILPPKDQHTAASSPSSSSSSGNGGRLLPAGVLAVEGVFAAGQAVTIVVRHQRTAGAPPTPYRRRSCSRGKSRDRGYDFTPSDTPEASRANSPYRGRSRPSTSTDQDVAIPTEDTAGTEASPALEEEEGWEDKEFGRGLTNYNSQEIDKIKGHKSSEIEKILGYIEVEHCVESITSLKKLEL